MFGVHPLIMTLSTMTFVQGFTLLFLSGAGGVVPGADHRPGEVERRRSFPPAFFWCVAAIVLVASVLLYRTPRSACGFSPSAPTRRARS